MKDIDISNRGVYYNLDISPYEFKTPYGDIYKFSSQKKLDIYKRDVIIELQKLQRFIKKMRLNSILSVNDIIILEKALYKAYYNHSEV